jgi:chaperonin GroES
MLRPLADNVVVREIIAPDRTEAGVIVPDQAKEHTKRGRVVAVGPEYRNDLQPGQVVLYPSLCGTPFKEADESPKLILLEHDEVLAIDDEGVDYV